MKVLLIDGTNIVMRYAYAMAPHMMDPAYPGNTMDEQSAAQILKAVGRAFHECATAAEATHMVVALDSSLPGERVARFPEYKARRRTSTNVWVNRLNIYLADHGIFTIRAPGFEADDVIATLVARIGRAGQTCAVLSGDSDLLVLASLWCDVYQFGGKGEPRFVKRTMRWIASKYEIVNSQMLTMYKALVGEPGDGLPGVQGIGKKKAAALLAEYRTPEAIRASGRLDQEHLDQFDLMLYLVTLREDVPLDPVQPRDCRIHPQPEATPV